MNSAARVMDGAELERLKDETLMTLQHAADASRFSSQITKPYQ